MSVESSEAAKEPQTATDLMGELWEEEKGGSELKKQTKNAEEEEEKEKRSRGTTKL